MSRREIRAALGLAAPLLLVLYAALLRFDAMVGKYGPVHGPPRMEAAQQSLRTLARRFGPPGLRWAPVGERRGDPKSYLKIARAKQSFYEASAREPLFLASIQFFLWLTGDQDIAVSCASMLYSTLLVLAAYFVGALVFSPAVGLAAGLLLAIEAAVISQGVDGWRDDSFAFFTVMTAHGLLRLRRAPSLAAACAAGAFAAGACLTRLSALSFFLPALAYLVLDGAREAWRKRAAHAALALCVAGALIAPFLVKNALVFGDPFYSVDFATEFYRGRAQLPVEQPLAWAAAFADRLGPHPLATADSLLRGFASYPLDNKWQGFDYLSPWLAPALRAAAIAGLLLLLGFADGRLLLVVLFGAMLPFAAIWETRTGAQWRFTLFAYPFYLVAACGALRAVVALAVPEARRRLTEGVRARRRWWAIVALALPASLAVAVLLPRWWAYLLVREAARADGAYSVRAGRADAPFFGDGWYAPVAAGNVVGRYSEGAESTMFFPVFERVDTRLTFRMQACSDQPQPARQVRVSVNGGDVSVLPVVWSSERAGSYETTVPKDLLREGWNRIDLRADGSTVIPPGEGRFLGLAAGQNSAFFLWYVRVAPAGAG